MRQGAAVNLADFHFLRPEWFLALLPILFLWFQIRQQKARSSWTAVCDSHLLPHILSGGAQTGQRRLGALLLCGVVLGVFALAGPTWNKLPQPVFRPQSALVILLDLSRSMDCPDISPSRLTRARYKVADILKLRQEGQTALIVFAGDAFTVTPLTTDTNTILSLLNTLSTSIMPSQGSRVDIAIEKGMQLVKQAGLTTGELLLIGDGYTDQRSVVAVEKSARDGFQLSVLGIGTTDAAPIPTGDGFLQDHNGSIVIPQLDELKLRDLAHRGGGRYQRISVDDRDISALMAASEQNLRMGEQQETEQFADRWQDQGYWLLLPLIPLAALSFRRGLLFSWLLLLSLSNPVQAFELDQLWKTADQQAAVQLEQGNAAAAADTFTDPQWRAVANYRAGQYQQAADALKDSKDGTSLYNRGNALAQLGNYPEAIQAYQQIPESDPNYADAQHNKELLQKLMQNEQQQENSSDQGQNKQNESGQNQPKDQNSKTEENSEQSENKDQESDRTEQNGNQQKAEQESAADRQESQQQQQTKENQPSPEEDGEKPTQALTDAVDNSKPESQDDDRWLQQIPDDPGNLLKRKFLYQYRQRKNHDEETAW